MERRRAARREPTVHESLSRLRLRTGRELTVLDLSDGGALAEGSTRLLPGTHVDVHVVTRNGRVLVRSRIARAYVCGVNADALRYRCALAFERTVDTAPAGYALPGDSGREKEGPGISYPEPHDVGAIADLETAESRPLT